MMERFVWKLMMLAAFGAVAPVAPGETRAMTSPPPVVPPFPGPTEDDLEAELSQSERGLIARARAKRGRRAALRTILSGA